MKQNRFYLLLGVISLYLFSLSILCGNNELVSLVAVLLSLPYYIVIFNGVKIKVNKYLLFMLLSLFIGSVMNLAISSAGFGGTVIIIGVISVSIFLIMNLTISIKHIFVINLLFHIFYGYKLFILELDPNDIYIGMSRNYIGLVLVLYSILYSFFYYVVYNKYDLVFCLITLFFTLYLVGRSSMGMQLLVVCSNYFHAFKHKKGVLLCALIIVIFVSSCILRDEIILLYKASSWGGYGLGSPRYEIWKDFFKHCYWLNYIMGIDTSKLPLASQYYGNLHNEFLNLIARTGFGAIVFMVIYITSIIRCFCAKKIYLVLLIFIASFRLCFDTGVFINNLGMTFYAIVLLPLYYKLKNKV